MTQRAHEPEAVGDDDPKAGDRASDAFTTAEQIRQYGDPVLRQQAQPVRRINAAVRDLAKRMAAAMYAVDGIGLAAPQIGESRRIVVYDTGDGLTTLINPKIVHAEGAEVDTEACLSVLGLCGEVERHLRVRVKAIDLDGKEITIDGEGHLARVLQHELDHLDGVLYTDRATAIRSSSAEDSEEAEDSPREGDSAAPK